MIEDEIHESWRAPLAGFFRSPEGRIILRDLDAILERDRDNYYPRRENIFAAFEKTPFDKVRVVIVGQDPYPRHPDATGLAFSTGGRMTSSLESIYAAIEYDDVPFEKPNHGNLERWAENEDVLLLNSALTVRRVDRTNMHRESWEGFIQAVVEVLAGSGRPIHFMLWGTHAHAFECHVHAFECHPEAPLCTVLKAYHPVADASDNDMNFQTCQHFSKVNTILRARKRAMERAGERPIQGVNYDPIDWSLPENP